METATSLGNRSARAGRDYYSPLNIFINFNSDCEDESSLVSKLRQWVTSCMSIEPREFDEIYTTTSLDEDHIKMLREPKIENPILKVVDGMRDRGFLNYFYEIPPYDSQDTTRRIEYLQGEVYWMKVAVREEQHKARVQLKRNLNDDEAASIRMNAIDNEILRKRYRAFYHLWRYALGFGELEYKEDE